MGPILELIALQANPDEKARPLTTGRSRLAGPAAWAVRASDVAAEARRLQAGCIAVSSPVQSGRERPDDTRLKWETAPVLEVVGFQRRAKLDQNSLSTPPKEADRCILIWPR
jgi:hypothetical protein